MSDLTKYEPKFIDTPGIYEVTVTKIETGYNEFGETFKATFTTDTEKTLISSYEISDRLGWKAYQFANALD